jgi:hypothetical protein
VSVDRALDFLAAAQLPTGEMTTLVGTSLDPEHAVHDPSVFATALVADCLTCSTDPRARAIVAAALGFLWDEMDPPGAWRFWTREHDGHRTMPVDLDDTACATDLLRRHGYPVPENDSLFLANRRRDGMFYTWVVLRRPSRGAWRHRQTFTLPAARPSRRAIFFQDNPRRGDVDSVVNANVLRVLGPRPATLAAMRELARITREGREASSDKWYRRPAAFHHALSKCAPAFAGQAADDLRDLAVRRVVDLLRHELAAPGDPLQVALLVCALCNWDHADPVLTPAIAFLQDRQQPDGSWPAVPMYFDGGPHEAVKWGSAELTTGFCVEAIVRAG